MLSLRLATDIKGFLTVSVRILLIFVFSTALSAAIADSDEWDVSRLMHQFSRVVHAKLVFKETRRSAFVMTDLVTEGHIEYRQPDYIEKNTVSPIVEKVVIDGDSMSIEKKGQVGKRDDMVHIQKYRVKSHPVLTITVESLRAILVGDIDRLNEGFEIKLDGSRTDWKLDLTPKTPDILNYFKQVLLYGSDARIHKVVSIQADGDQSTVDLTYQLLLPANP